MITFGVTCDVASLYASIPHSQGIQAISFYLEHHTNLSIPQQLFVLEVLEYLLMHNYFIIDVCF